MMKIGLSSDDYRGYRQLQAENAHLHVVVDRLLHEVCHAATYIQQYYRPELKEFAQHKVAAMLVNAERAVEGLDVGNVLQETRALMQKDPPPRPSNLEAENVQLRKRNEALELRAEQLENRIQMLMEIDQRR